MQDTPTQSPPSGLALSIRQPWAWLIIHAGKDIENRSWHISRQLPRGTKLPLSVLVHAAKGMTWNEYMHARAFAYLINPDIPIPRFEEMERGGIIGEVTITDCVKASRSPWYMGQWGFVLQDPKPLPFFPARGQLGFFEVGP